MNINVQNSLNQNLNFDVDWSVSYLSIYNESRSKAFALVDKILREMRAAARKNTRVLDSSEVSLLDPNSTYRETRCTESSNSCV